jgi:hypothetical protein
MLRYNYCHHAKVFGSNPTGDFLFTFPYLDLQWLYINRHRALQNPVLLGDWSFAKGLPGLVAHPLLNWSTIRIYAERFKALIREGERETVCTFFRNNPIHPDDPAYGR